MANDFVINTDRYTHHTSRAGTTYYKFNVYIRDGLTPPRWEILSIGWRFQEGKLLPPFSKVGPAFFNMMYISGPMAEALYQNVIAQISTLEDVTLIPKACEAAIVAPRNFVKTMPNFYETTLKEKVMKKKEGVPTLKLHIGPETPSLKPPEVVRAVDRMSPRRIDGDFMPPGWDDQH